MFDLVKASIAGAAAEMMVAFRAARKNRLAMSIGIAPGSSLQIALFVAPVLVLLLVIYATIAMTLYLMLPATV